MLTLGDGIVVFDGHCMECQHSLWNNESVLPPTLSGKQMPAEQGPP